MTNLSEPAHDKLLDNLIELRDERPALTIPIDRLLDALAACITDVTDAYMATQPPDEITQALFNDVSGIITTAQRNIGAALVGFAYANQHVKHLKKRGPQLAQMRAPLPKVIH